MLILSVAPEAASKEECLANTYSFSMLVKRSDTVTSLCISKASLRTVLLCVIAEELF